MIAAKQRLDPTYGVKLIHRIDGNLFNLRRLQARTLVTHESVLELQYADDAAFVRCSAEGLHANLDVVVECYQGAGLVINTGKTEAMAMEAQALNPPNFKISDARLNNVDRFCYLGSLLSSSGNIDEDVQRSIGMASSSFVRLTPRVFTSRDLSIHTKVKVYRAVCLSVLLYASETWVPYRRHLKKLEKFHTECLQRIHRVPHVEMRRRAGIEPVEAIMAQRHLRWLGHTIRMPISRLPRQILYGQLEQGYRTVGGQKKRYKDHLNMTMKKCGMRQPELETLASDRSQWREACRVGLATYNENYIAAAEERRARRHEQPAADGQFVCDRSCAARIGLIIHQRAHQR